MHARGLSTRDIEASLKEATGNLILSRSAVSKTTEILQKDFENKDKSAKIIFIDSTTLKLINMLRCIKKKEDTLRRLLAALGVDSQQKYMPDA